MNKKSKYYKSEFGLFYVWAKMYFKNSLINIRSYWSVILMYLPFTKDLKCEVMLFWEPIIHSIIIFIIFYIFYYNKLELLNSYYIDLFREYRFYFFMLFILIFILFFFYYINIILKDKKGWYDFIKSYIIIFVNIIINFYLILYLFDISIIEFIQYTIIFQIYKIIVIIINIINKVLKKNIKYYGIKGFIGYPYLYVILIFLLIVTGCNCKFGDLGILSIYNNFKKSYQYHMYLKFYKRGGFVIIPTMKKIIKW